MGMISRDERERREKIVRDCELNPEDTSSWHQKFSNHQKTATHRGLQSSLSFEQYVQKAKDAGLTTPDQIGKKVGQYCLGRESDVGDYLNSNCRFITTTQNRLESVENCRSEDYYQQLRGSTKETNKAVAQAADKLAKPFSFVDPNGTVHQGRNLNQFCKDNDLNQGAMWQVGAGRKDQHKGWTRG